MSIKIGNIDVRYFKVGGDDCSIYLGTTLLYPQSTPPTPTVRYAVVENITTYTSTTYVDVYNKADDKWYKRNNLNEYEEYGVYGNSTGVSATYYDGKLAIVDNYEYQYSGNSWVNVGEVSSSTVSYEISNSDQYAYQGVELPTTFQISKADIEAIGGWLDFRIRVQDGGSLNIGTDQYYFEGATWEEGTVTSDNDYYYYSLPNTQSIIIDSIEYWNSTPIHIIVGGEEYPIYYVDRIQPDFYRTYSSLEALSAETDVFDGKYGQIGDVIYKYNNGWNTTNDRMMVGTAISGIKSFTFDLNNTYPQTGNAKCFVNGSSDENGVSEWVYQNNDTISGLTFDPYNNINTSDNLLSIRINNLDTSGFITGGTSGFNYVHNLTKLQEIEVPSSITYITVSDWINVNSNCPLKVYFKGNNDINVNSNLTSDFIQANSLELYLYNGIKFNNWTLTVPYYNNGLKIYAPSSAVTAYRNDTYAKYYIPFIVPLDDGQCDLSYSYIASNYRGYNTKSLTVINFTDTTIYSSTFTSLKNGNWSRYKFGSNVATIAYQALYASSANSSNYWVQNFKIEEGVTVIYNYAFSQPNSTSRQVMNSFHLENCQEVRRIEIPDSVTYIGTNAFERNNTNLYTNANEEIVIGSGVTSIGYRAFYNGVSNIYATIHATITIKATTPPTLGAQAFYQGTTQYIDAIYVPAESVDAYKAATNWSDYASVIQAIPNS